MRLNKFLASAGVASRRKADKLILSGQIKINGKVKKEPYYDVAIAKDKVVFNKEEVISKDEKIYFVLNKPPGYVCTNATFKNEKSVLELLPPEYNKLIIAGRLDKNSTGLIVLTNDGDLVYQLTHPSFMHKKEYTVVLNQKLSEHDLSRLERGVKLEEGIAKFDDLKIKGTKTYNIVLHQGWNRQIRRMFEAVNKRVVNLARIRIGDLILSGIELGKYQQVTRNKIIKKPPR